MQVLKGILIAVMTIVLLAGIFCLVVLTAGAINGMSFAQQWQTWFGRTQTVAQSAIAHFTI